MTKLLSLLKIVCIVAAIGSTQSADQCLNFPSGIQRMVRGIDVTKLDLSPQNLAQSNGFQRALVSLTCTQGKKWQHPFDPTLVFDIPDQVDTINTLPGGVLNTKATLIETTEDFKKSKGFDLGLDVNTVAYGAYGVSGSFKQAQEDLVNSTKSIVEVSAFVSAIRVDMSPYYETTPNQEFQDFVEKQLPDTIAANPAKYQEFVDTFGTHYFDSAFFGGFVQQSIELSSNLNLKMSEKDIKVNAEASFLSVVKIKGGYSGEDKNVTQEFKQDSQVFTAFYGGKANLLKDNNSWAQWWETVPRDPWLFGGNLKPIDNLIKGAKKPQVAEAVRVKLDKTFLQETKQELILFKKFSPVSVDSYVASIDKLLTQSIPTHDDVKAVKQSVADFLAKETAKLDKAFLNGLEQSLQSVQNTELFCKRVIADKCMSDHLADVDKSIEEGKQLFTKADQLKNTDIPNRDQFKEVSRNVEKYIYTQKHEKIGECSEKVFCNLCKITEATVTHKDKCNSHEIKDLLNIHV